MPKAKDELVPVYADILPLDVPVAPSPPAPQPEPAPVAAPAQNPAPETLTELALMLRSVSPGCINPVAEAFLHLANACDARAKELA